MWRIAAKKKKWSEQKQVVTGKVALWIVNLLVLLLRTLSRMERRLSLPLKKRLFFLGFGLGFGWVVWLLVTALLRPTPRPLPDFRLEPIDTVGLHIRHQVPVRKIDSSAGTGRTKQITF